MPGNFRNSIFFSVALFFIRGEGWIWTVGIRLDEQDEFGKFWILQWALIWGLEGIDVFFLSRQRISDDFGFSWVVGVVFGSNGKE